jgi:hypothetical protein
MKRDLIYLNMNDFNKGRKIFGVGSNFDYYILKNTNSINNYTIINDIDNKEYKINLNEWNFIPNGKLNLFKKLLASKRQEKVNILYNRSLY